MLAQLVESSPRAVRRRVSSLVSVILHALVLTAAAAAARPVPLPPAAPDVVIPVYPPKPPTSEGCRECGSRKRGPGSEGPEVQLPGPITTPVEIEVSDAGPIVDRIDIPKGEWRTGRGDGPGSQPTEISGAAGTVDREVIPWPTNPVPRYPAELRTVRVQGSVSTRFVVDTTGRVIMESVVVDATTHQLFADAVLDALRRSRYAPAELGGRKVRQLVSQSFVFVMRD